MSVADFLMKEWNRILKSDTSVVVPWNDAPSVGAFPLPPLLHTLRRVLPDGAMVAGGSAIALFNMDHKFEDVDVFCRSIDVANQVIEQLNIEFDSQLGPISPKHKGKVFVVHTASDDPIQLIVTDKTHQETLDSFDLSLCRVGFTNKGILFDPSVKAQIQNRTFLVDWESQGLGGYDEGDLELRRPNGIEQKDLVRAKKTLRRMFKYINKGYTPEGDAFQQIEHYFEMAYEAKSGKTLTESSGAVYISDSDPYDKF